VQPAAADLRALLQPVISAGNSTTAIWSRWLQIAAATDLQPTPSRRRAGCAGEGRFGYFTGGGMPWTRGEAPVPAADLAGMREYGAGELDRDGVRVRVAAEVVPVEQILAE
jgi:hypothetical protein